MSVRTRFAPSPTGSLHVGGVRTALYCLLFARRHGGRFLLRIEDTDRARSTEASTQGILRDLRWLNLHWDEGPETEGPVGPYLQSQRIELYEQHQQVLMENGRAYRAWESREELSQLRNDALREKKGFRYRKVPYTAEQLAQFQAEQRIPVTRFEAPRTDIVVRDHILGEVTLGENDQDDFVIRKTDGFPTYHFAVVVDDHFMEVTHILRGQEHLMNTPKHIGLYDAFGWTPPEVGHLPLIFNPNGSKMSKRDKARTAREAARNAAKERGQTGKGWAWLAEITGLDEDHLFGFMKKKHDTITTAETIARVLHVSLPMIDVMDFLSGGFLPEALVNYMALLGWSPGDDREIMTIDEMASVFSLERIGKTAARFDPAKLRWMNGEYMKSLPIETLLTHLQEYLDVVSSPFADLTDTERATYLELFRERAATFADLDRQAEFLFERPTQWDRKASKKHLLKGGGLDRLRQCKAALGGLSRWDTASIESAIQGLLTDEEPNISKFAQPVRIAVSGGPVSPSIAETLALLTQDEVIQRIEDCLSHFAVANPNAE